VDYDKVEQLLRKTEQWDESSRFEVAPVLDHINNRTSAIVTIFIVKYYDTVRFFAMNLTTRLLDLMMKLESQFYRD
jgi:hypothetical protein